MDSAAPLFWQGFLGIADIFYNAAAALPLIAAMGLIVGRRGNGRFCLWGTEKILSLALPLSLIGPIRLLGSYLLVVLPHSGGAIWAPLMQSAGMPYTSALIVWLSGCLVLYFAQGSLAPAIFNYNAETDLYPAAYVKFPLGLCLGAAFAFFLTFILINWPFAGLPPGMDMDRAAMAVCRNGARHYFMAFCPAGAICLLLAFHVFHKTPHGSDSQKLAGIRWCAIWAAIGYLPHILQSWGFVIGIGFRGTLPGHMASGMLLQVVSLSLLTVAAGCWFWLFFTKRPRQSLAWLAFCLLLARGAMPWLGKIFAA